ncbi:cysteine desulfurase [Clostridium polyendosporum]|uniref:Cysteine desulfurase n=1 Tax=Clostridium polyendosporum TaxID=69208 RepID=A0A919S001_9CLOT|nr:aminotransferase class V-fold PLP-dependent enzyme [Clostridium polyendosporum]GIM29349.1 cysteine desulfurase [Clostridium polyendosporum]
MKTVYLDNSTVSLPKAPNMSEHISEFLSRLQNKGNPLEYINITKNLVEETRELVCKLLKFDKKDNVIFTQNSTYALNMILKGLLNKGDHVIVPTFETDSIIKPLNSLIGQGIDISKVPCNLNGHIDTNTIIKLINKHTKAIILSHVSNVSGTIAPIEEIGQICKRYNLYFIINASHSCGAIDFGLDKVNADAVVFSGSKYLLGLEGIGGFLIKDSLSENINPLIDGTSRLENESGNSSLPFKLEKGPLNPLGICSLNYSLKFLLNEGVENIQKKNFALTELFINKISNIDGIKIIGEETMDRRSSIVSICYKDIPSNNLEKILLRDFSIYTKSGFHSSINAHKAFGTYPNGTLRFSFGYFNNEDDVIYTIDSVNSALKYGVA